VDDASPVVAERMRLTGKGHRAKLWIFNSSNYSRVQQIKEILDDNVFPGAEDGPRRSAIAN
jgi:hypothetical protein